METELPTQKGGGAPSPILGPCLLWPNALMDQDGTCMEVCLGQGHILPDGDPALLPKNGAEPSTFGPFLWPNHWMYQDATWYGGRPPLRRLCVRWRPSPLPKKGVEPPPQLSAHFYCGQTAGCIKMPLGKEVGLSTGDFRLMWTQLPRL